ncbi:MAG TPA: hypothetical protein VLE43_01290 [Candidatus Saccharimonadia bacterium]|nr:hypothetical protein [Candidatus Saccharimonadia bacterium]
MKVEPKVHHERDEVRKRSILWLLGFAAITWAAIILLGAAVLRACSLPVDSPTGRVSPGPVAVQQFILE